MPIFSRSIIASACLLLSASTAFTEDFSPKGRIAPIGERISKCAGIEARILVVDERKPEAYVYPDKTIVVTTGLVNLAENDDETAFVIGHEMAHIAKEHGNGEKILALLNNPSLPDRERQEIEADLNGINYARRAGYDPSSAGEFLSRLLHYAGANTEAFSKRLDAISIYLADIGQEE